MSGQQDLVRPETGAAPGEELDPERVAHLLATLGKSVRAHQIYHDSNPVYQRFVATVHEGFTTLWDLADALELRVDEDGFIWQKHRFAVGEGRESLPFMFYKDGVRFLTFRPGFEDEVEQFLDVLHRSRQANKYGDDLITLLWEADFQHFQAGYVDQLADTVDLPMPGAGLQAPISTLDLKLELEEEQDGAAVALATGPGAEPQPPKPAVKGITAEDFEETLFFLEDAEMERVAVELDKEWHRDVKMDVMNALFDRLEDPLQAQQEEILGVLHQLLPILLGRGELSAASNLVLELQTIVDQGEVLTPDLTDAAVHLLDQLSQPQMLGQLVRSIEEGVIDPDAAELGVFLNYLKPQALPQLIRATELTTVPGLRERFRSAIEGIARDNAGDVVEMLRADDVIIASGAARLAGRLRMASAVDGLGELLESDDPDVRLAGVEALVAVHTSATVEPLQRALSDDSRDVRVAAARGLGSLRYAPARLALEGILGERAIRDADLTEKIAFFEAYAAVAGGEGVPLLNRLLNGRGFMGGRQPPEVRACAARALGRIPAPSARQVLTAASGDKDPLVRSAVHSALRGEGDEKAEGDEGGR